MQGRFRKRGCKCPDKKKCKCDATWSFTLDLGRHKVTNKRRQKEVSGFPTKKEAERACAALITEYEQGTYAEESNVLFKAFSNEWLGIYSASKDVKVSTLRVRQHEIDKLMFYFEHFKIKDITRELYQDALNDMKKRGYADNTVDGVHCTGKMIFKMAMQMDKLKNDPTQYSYVPKTKKTVEELEQEEEVVKYLEKDELSKFLKTAREKGLERDYAIFMVLAYSGIRVGELCALKWKDCSFTDNTISITKTYFNPKNNAILYQLLTLKTKTSKRTIDLYQTVFDELKKHRVLQNEINMNNRDTYHDKDFVFAKVGEHLGYPEFPEAIMRRMRRILKLAGLNERLGPHSMRHTHTSLLAEAGVGLHEIMTRLGHKDDKVTKSVYMHVTKTMKKEASHKFGALMRSL